MKASKRFALLLAVGISITLLLSPVLPGRASDRPAHIILQGNTSETSEQQPETAETTGGEDAADESAASDEETAETTDEETAEADDVETTDETASDEAASDDADTAAEPEYDPEAAALEQETWFQRELIIEADRLYLAGDIAAAEELYREAKT